MNDGLNLVFLHTFNLCSEQCLFSTFYLNYMLGVGIELLLCQSTDLLTGPHYIMRMNLMGGAWITKVTQKIENENNDTPLGGTKMHQERLETNRLKKLFDPEHAYGGFHVKVKAKNAYTGISFSKAGEEEDPVLQVKNRNEEEKQEEGNNSVLF